MAALALDSFCGIREALYGVFDGDKNVEVPNLLQCTMGDVLAEELHRNQREEDYMTSTFLTMQRYTHGWPSLEQFGVFHYSLVLFSFHFFSLKCDSSSEINQFYIHPEWIKTKMKWF